MEMPPTASANTPEAFDHFANLFADQRFLALVNSAPIGICVFVGQNLIIQGANELIKEFMGKGNNIEGKPLVEVMPELEGRQQPFVQLLQNVLRTGERFEAKAVKVMIERRGQMTTNYFDISFSPILNQAGETVAVLDISIDVTADALAKQQVAESEQTLRRLANAMPQLVWVSDAAGSVSFYNERIAEFAGAVKNEDGHWTWEGLLHPEDVAATQQAWTAAVLSGHDYEAEHRIQMKNGQYRWHLSRGLPQRNAAGEVEHWFGTATDIHDQKVLSEQIAESETRFRKLAETLPQLIWSSDESGNNLFASKKWQTYSEETDVHKAWEAMAHPDDKERAEQFFANSQAFGVGFQADLRLKGKDGKYRWHQSVAEPVKDAEGNVTQWVGAITDIHDQRNQNELLEQLVEKRTAELVEKNQALENSESFLLQIIDSSVEFITVVDVHLRYITVNRRFEEAMGWRRHDIKGKLLQEVNSSVKGTPFYHALLQALEGETVFLDKRPSHNRPGAFVETYFVPLRLGGQVHGAIIMTRDVTDIVRSNLMLEQQNKELERSNGDLQQFAHVASHDLKEPVRKIRTFSERLAMELSKVPTTPKALQFLQKIDASAQRMFSMIEGVLQYSHVEASQEAWERVDLNDVLAQVEVDFELVLQNKQASLRLGHLPSVLGAPLQLQQLFYNLVNNALKFSKNDLPPVITVQSRPMRGSDLPADLRLPQMGHYHQIILSDNGVGFSQQYAEAIFKTFTRLHPKDAFEGTGLGLALCKKIAERHGGAIYARGHEGRGASFFVVLPADQR